MFRFSASFCAPFPPAYLVAPICPSRPSSVYPTSVPVRLFNTLIRKVHLMNSWCCKIISTKSTTSSCTPYRTCSYCLSPIKCLMCQNHSTRGNQDLLIMCTFPAKSSTNPLFLELEIDVNVTLCRFSSTFIDCTPTPCRPCRINT